MHPMAEFAALYGQVNDGAATARTTPKVSVRENGCIILFLPCHQGNGSTSKSDEMHGLTLPITCRGPTVSSHVHSEPQTGRGRVERLG